MIMHLHHTLCNTLQLNATASNNVSCCGSSISWLIHRQTCLHNKHARTCVHKRLQKSVATLISWRTERYGLTHAKPEKRVLVGNSNPIEPYARSNMLRNFCWCSRRTCLYHDVGGRKELERCELCDSFHFSCTPACGARDTRTRRHLAW